ncbi:MAG: hypothetical protein U0412_01315 [Nitrospira sp.]
MTQSGLDKHQLAGLDDRERGFSRPVDFERDGAGYRALLRYESVRLTTDSHPTQDAALQVLIQTLHRQGYRQLKTQMSFRNGVYLGSQELWIEYPDPTAPSPPPGLLARFTGWFRRPSDTDSRP